MLHSAIDIIELDCPKYLDSKVMYIARRVLDDKIIRLPKLKTNSDAKLNVDQMLDFDFHGIKGGYLDFSHLIELKKIYISLKLT